MYIVAPESRGYMAQDTVYVPFNFLKFQYPELQKTPKVFKNLYGHIVVIKYNLILD